MMHGCEEIISLTACATPLLSLPVRLTSWRTFVSNSEIFSGERVDLLLSTSTSLQLAFTGTVQTSMFNSYSKKLVLIDVNLRILFLKMLLFP
jgi:hypothetical protein